ncbi:Bile acid:sodium symporter [Saccharomonospora sp. CUA-673]|uniref:bile acid:sodium symporter family protein n=1 Tax=Saccharomonospora sp. CUA-673 TaxID=1904969 RepID=UPI000968987D|nr:bile acid:sodium symporter family protein [Saccharomonospora sp. CUA-673]OLT48938.1 Bile acid:sodium symporter [Saccharomonospora sp. CUA-673]
MTQRRGIIRATAELAGKWFGLLVLLGAVVGMVIPDQTSGLADHVPIFLGIIMFGMGLTLRAADFLLVARRPLAILFGLLAQFAIMPFTAWGISQALGLTGALLIGMVLLGSAPGGTASNVIVYLSKGDVALSVTLTSVSTLLAPVVTPLLVLLLAGSNLPVGFGDMFVSVAQVVLIPVLAGLVLRAVADRWVQKFLPYLPLVSVTGIVVVVAGIVGANADTIATSGWILLLAVIAHNTLGLGLGYGAAKLAGLDESTRRAVSVEVGMQNSGLASSLATTHFEPAAALPGAVSSVWHNLSGSLLASYWARHSPRPADKRPEPDEATEPTAP